MYPVIFKALLRLRVALATFFLGGVSTAIISGLGLSSGWYTLVPFAALFGAAFYLHFTGEWIRVLYKKRREPETRRKIVRLSTLLFFVGLLAPFLDNVYYQDFGPSYPLHSIILAIAALALGSGVVTITFGLFTNWNSLPVKVETSARDALRMMKEAGFGVSEDPLWIVIDPAVQDAAARTYPGGGESVILVSPGSVNTKWFGGLERLLVHEMSHIYRRERKHPSENQDMINQYKAYYQTKQNITKGYQLNVLVRSMISLMEIPINDLAFRVLETSGLPWVEPAREFFQKLAREKPSWTLGARHKRWKTALVIADNSSYIGQMDRHKIPDTGAKAKSANQKLLSSLPGASELYDYFYKVVLELKEEVTEEEFKKLVGNCLGKLVEFARA